MFSNRQVSIIFTFCFGDLDSRVVARCHAHSAARYNFIPLCFAEVRGHGVAVARFCALCSMFFLLKRIYWVNRHNKFVEKVFIHSNEDCACVRVNERSVHLRNSWWDLMSINLSVVFYGKGVPRRAGTCSRRVGARGRDSDYKLNAVGLWEPWSRRQDRGEYVLWISVEQRARDAGRATACIHLWPARGASAAQGRCAAWRSLVTWREGCSPPPLAPAAPTVCLCWQSRAQVLAHSNVARSSLIVKFLICCKLY